MSFSISIPVKPISWNVLARKNRFLYTKIFNQWKYATMIAISQARDRPKQPYSIPVAITVHARWKGRRRHDVDGIMAKPVIDQLVSSGILKDDSLPFVTHVLYSGETSADKDELIISICSAKYVL